MKTEEEIRSSLSEMERMTKDALRGKSTAMKNNCKFLVDKFQEWRVKSEARAQILRWVLDMEDLDLPEEFRELIKDK